MSEAEEMNDREVRLRLVAMEQVIERLMYVLSITATPDQIDAIRDCDDQWSKAINDWGLDPQ